MNNLQRGFTMIELLVTLAIAAFLTAGLSALLVQSKQTYKTQQTVSHMMEDGRYILEVLSKESRRIGFLRNKHALGGAAAQVFVADNAVLGSGVNLGSGAFIGGAYSAGGFGGNAYNVNQLVFRYQLNDATDLSASMPNYANSPCTRSIHLTLENDPINNNRSNEEIDEDPTSQINVVTIYLYVALDATNTPVLYCKAKRVNYSYPNPDPDGVAPHRDRMNPISDAEPLISNVERFLVLYGVDTDSTADGEANVYRRADSVTDWQKVVSVRLYAVLYSDETNVVQGTPSYRINGESVTPDAPADKRLYRVFSTTISSRNR